MTTGLWGSCFLLAMQQKAVTSRAKGLMTSKPLLPASQTLPGVPPNLFLQITQT